MKTRNIMLDLETMGLGSNAAIIAIGACEFDNDTILQTFYKIVSLESSVKSGGVMDASTVLWWLKQDEAARAEFEKPDNVDIMYVLRHFDWWLKELADTTTLEPYEIAIWGNGVRFDNEILENAYKRAGLKTPWGYKADRCYRTVKALFPQIKIEYSGTAHNALDDAVCQVKHLQAIAKVSGIQLW